MTLFYDKVTSFVNMNFVLVSLIASWRISERFVSLLSLLMSKLKTTEKYKR